MSTLNLLASFLALAGWIALALFGFQALKKRPGAARKAGAAAATILVGTLAFYATDRSGTAASPSVKAAAPQPAAPAPATASAPYIDVQAKVTGPYTVEFAADTNLPDGAVLAVDLGLADQKPDDVAIGTGFERFVVSGGKVSGTIDGTRRVMPANSTLPAGTYDVEVSFHPLWEENRALATHLKIDDSLVGTDRVELAASGESAAVAQMREQNQKWVMANVGAGTPWNESDYVRRFGTYKELRLESGNPDVLKMYYFPDLDMTFMVNVLKNEIAVWRMGKAHR
ncbi:hypothetical protein [Deinococcus wulumuqiensis]|uniref:hypothetical protein n=1 Tax=Deinococcus wulumuqiensis TaxID=980427 RepID=UPI00242A6450|nr:hypothetical protein [Deinococcus wulumuqiensis]